MRRWLLPLLTLATAGVLAWAFTGQARDMGESPCRAECERERRACVEACGGDREPVECEARCDDRAGDCVARCRD